MEFIVEFVNAIIYFGCVINIGELFLDYKRKKIRNKNIILFLVILLTTVLMLYPNVWLRSLVHIISVILTLNIWFDENWKNILGLYIGTTVVLSVLAMLFEVISAESILYLKVVEADNIIEVFNLALMLFCIRVVGKYYKNKYANGLKNIGIKYWVLFVVIMFFDASVILLLGDFVLNALQAERKYIPVFSYWCVVIGLLIQLVLLINTLVTRNVHKENEKLAKQFLESQNEHYQYLEKREHETKKFRHDIKNHLILLENFINNHKYDEAEEYLKTINEKVSTFSNQVSVNNGIADAILNRFYSEAQEKGIVLKVSGHFPMDCYITAYDICTILSNLLSNAILAETEAEGKEVLVHIKYTDDKVLLTVENDYAHDLDEVDGVFKTTKKDSLGHGYGLSNVKECVENNGGYVSISTENNRFKVMIMMLNENEEML